MSFNDIFELTYMLYIFYNYNSMPKKTADYYTGLKELCDRG